MMILFVFILLLVPGVILTPPPFAVYSLTQDPTTNQNYIHILSGNSSTGLLTDVNKISTNGNGTGTSGLQSQNGLLVFGNYLFGVNPGSNSVSMFTISTTDPTVLTLVSTVDSGGEWPLSLAAYGNNLCVVNGGAKNGIRCYSISATKGLSSTGDLSLNLSLTTPPKSHFGPAQISFSNDGAALVVSVKGLNPPFWLFPFTNGAPSSGVNTSAHGAVSFGFTFDTDGTILLTDANPYGNGSGVILIHPSISPAPSVSFVTNNYYVIPGQNSSCWIIRSNQTKNFYVANAASNSISEISRSGNTLAVVKSYLINGKGGPTNLAIATVGEQDWLYVAAGGITTFKIISAGSATNEGSISVASLSIAAYVPGSTPSSPVSSPTGPSIAPTSPSTTPSGPSTTPTSPSTTPSGPSPTPTGSPSASPSGSPSAFPSTSVCFFLLVLIILVLI